MKKIVRVSRLLKWTACAMGCGLPVAEAGYWITNGYPFLEPLFQASALPSFGEYPISWTTLNEMQRGLGFLISLMPLAFSMASLFYLSHLFAAFEKLELFETKNVQILKKAGWALVWGQIVYPFYTACMSLALTYRNPVGHRTISVALGSLQLEILAIGLSILLASWVFEEAVKIREEQMGTV